MEAVMAFYPQQADTAATGQLDTGRRRRSRSGADDRISHLFWLTVFVLGCISLVCVTGAASWLLGKKGAEKPLQGSLLLPKLIHSHGERQAIAWQQSQTKSSAWDDPKERKATEVPSHWPVVVEQKRDKEQDQPVILPFATQEPPFVDLLTHTAPQTRLPPPSSVQTCDDPVVYLQPCTPHHEDSPMIRNWKTLTLYSLLSAAAVVYVPQPTIALAAGNGDSKKDDAIKDLSKQIEKLADRIKALEEKKPEPVDYVAINKSIASGFKELREDILSQLKMRFETIREEVKGVSENVDKIHKDVATIKDDQIKLQRQLATQKILIDQLGDELLALQKRKQVVGSSPTETSGVDKASLDEIRTRLNSIQDTIAKLATKTQISMSPPTNGSTNITSRSMGRVVLRNSFSREVAFIVNGVVYRVPPSFHTIIDVPSGLMRYEFFADGSLLDRGEMTVTSGESIDMTARVR